MRIPKLSPIPTVPLIVLVIICIIAIFAPYLSTYHPNKGSLYDQFKPPIWMDEGNRAHILGTDYFGRDILSRLFHGARVSLSVAVLAITFSAILGTILGLISGYYGGIVDAVIMRVVDALLSFPTILVAILLAVTLGPSYLNVILILALLVWPRYARQIRGETLAVKEQDYVALARVSGCSPSRIMILHIFPNVVPTLLVLATFQIAEVIMMEALLSFLGVGVPPPTPSWGSMAAAGRDYIASHWWLSAFPGLAILITILSINLIGDWIRDRLDPRLRQV
jgi:peptide/nickel transport system permease protein